MSGIQVTLEFEVVPSVPAILIPFREEFRDLLLTGGKTATSRNTGYGAPGTVFEAFGARFVITAIRRLTLREVAEKHFAEEGLESAEEFVDVWQKVYPFRGFDPDHRVWYHEFRRVA